jgi:DNA-binding IclR family transcriptional regulator
MEQRDPRDHSTSDAPATSIEKALDVLFHLHTAAAPTGVTAIGRALGIPKSSTHRLLAALTGRGLVERDDRGRYVPGMALVALGVGLLDREPLIAAARPLLEAEAAELEETVFLMAARAGRIRVLDKVEGTGFLRAAPRIGEEIPVHATAVGRLYLSLDRAQLEFDDSDLEQFTEQTPASRAALERRIAVAGERGWDVNDEEWIAGLKVIAVPIVVSEKLVGALAIAAPAGAVTVADPARSAERLRDAAVRIAARMQGELQ